MKNSSRTNFLILALIILLVGGAAAFIAWRLSQNQPTTPEPGEAACGSTEARVQCEPWTQCPWKSSLTIKQGETFRIASFHNGSDTFANDTRLVVTNPTGSVISDCTNTSADAFSCNSKQITNTSVAGKYTLSVTTTGGSGGSCSGTATVTVQGTNAAQCTYNSTEARFQIGSSSSWVASGNIKAGDTFKIGSFHNASTSFATDTKLVVKDPSGTTVVSCDGSASNCNGKSVVANSTGNYTLTVTTGTFTDSKCSGSASIAVGQSTTASSSSSSSSGGVGELPQTALIGDEQDKILIGVILLGLGVFTIIYATRLRKNYK